MANYDKMAVLSGGCKSILSPCEEVGDIDTEVREFIPYLIRTMRREDGMGICANQVGINKAVFITNVPGDHIRIFINPQVIETSGVEIAAREGCLSFQGKVIHRQRKRHAIIRALNLKGEQFILDSRYKMYPANVSMLLSVCLQHEMDHINGIDMREYSIVKV